jgi:hypothetical protein
VVGSVLRLRSPYTSLMAEGHPFSNFATFLGCWCHRADEDACDRRREVFRQPSWSVASWWASRMISFRRLVWYAS